MQKSGQTFGQKIRSFFINEDSLAEDKAEIKQDNPSASSSLHPSSPIPETNETNEVDQKFAKHFFALFENSNLSGPDYFEFKQALKSLGGLELTEEKQFQAAWVSFKTLGQLTDHSILSSSADQYLSLLDQDRMAFLKNAELAITNRVGSLEDEFKKLQQTNTELTQQITAIQNQIKLNEERSNQISEEIAQHNAKINENKKRYEIAYNIFSDEIKSDLNKIKKYLH